MVYERNGDIMISFFNEFISYLLLVIIMACIAVCGVFAGKKLRDKKDLKDASSKEGSK